MMCSSRGRANSWSHAVADLERRTSTSRRRLLQLICNLYAPQNCGWGTSVALQCCSLSCAADLQ
jgi:hypothetical protein